MKSISLKSIYGPRRPICSPVLAPGGQDFKDALNVNSYKRKGDRQDFCKYRGNYRGISLLAIASTIFAAKILLQRLLVVANYVFPEAQCGFHSSRSTTDMTFTLRQRQEKAAEQAALHRIR